MKLLAYVLLAITLAGAAIASGVLLHSDFTEPQSAFAVPFSLRSADHSPTPVSLSTDERRCVETALKRHGKRIKNVEVLAEAFIANRYANGNSESMRNFSVEIALQDGAVLSSRLRSTSAKLFAQSLRECIEHCLRQYDSRIAQGIKFRQLSNL